MKYLAVLIVAILTPCAVCATTYYVNANRPDDSGNGLSWAAAKRTIQAAVDAASSNDTVLVTNGVYRSGGRHLVSTAVTNRVLALYPVTIRSVNGPAVTVIEGAPSPLTGGCGTGAVRCADLRNGATLIGFTLSNGFTSVYPSQEQSWGGGVHALLGHVRQCIITRCTAENYGGGAYLSSATMDATLVQDCAAEVYGGSGIHAYRAAISNCIVRRAQGYSAFEMLGGCTGVACIVEENATRGVSAGTGSVLYNSRIANNHGQGVSLFSGARLSACTVFGNYSAEDGGGVRSHVGMIDNCVIVSNVAAEDGGGVYLSSFSNIVANCTIVANVASNRGGGLFCSTLSSNFNTVILYNWAGDASGSNYFNDGSGIGYWGCCSVPVPPGTIGQGNFTGDPRFVDPAGNDYHLGAGSACFNAGQTAWAVGSEDREGVQRIIGGFVDVGAHEYVPQLAVASPEHFVAVDGGNVWPYTNAATAARTLQAGLDAAGSGDRVLVAPGLYHRNYASHRGLKSRAVAALPVSIEALASNTPGATILLGEPDIGGGMGVQGFAMRSVTVTSGVAVTGLTISNGYTRNGGTPINFLRAGGGALCDRGGTLKGCVIAGNQASDRAGGVMCNSGGTLENCVVQGNRALLGGAAFLDSAGVARNCLVTRNAAGTTGGGLYLDDGGRFESCTIADNSAGASGGGVYLSSSSASNLNNIVYFNAAGTHTNCQFIIGRIGYSCLLPLPDGVFDAGGNISAAPWFAHQSAGDYHLLAGSSGVDAGTNLPWMAGATDLDGNPRIYDGRVDMGCYEYVPEPTLGLLAAFTIYNLQVTISKKRRRGEE